MSVHLRQICLAAADLAAVVAALSRHLGLAVAHEDPAVAEFGLENRLLRVDHQFLEVVAPRSTDAPVQRFLKRRGGDGGYMAILQVVGREAREGVLARAKAMGIRTVFEAGGETWKLTQFHPADTGGSFLDIEWDAAEDPKGPWFAAGGLDWREAPASSDTLAIQGATIRAVEPEATAARWAALLGVPREGTTLRLNEGELRFTPAGGQADSGISAVSLSVRDPEALIRAADADARLPDAAGLRLAGVDFLLSV